MEFELSGIFWVKMVTTNIVFGSLWTHFVHMSVKKVKKHVTYATVRINMITISMIIKGALMQI